MIFFIAGRISPWRSLAFLCLTAGPAFGAQADNAETTRTESGFRIGLGGDSQTHLHGEISYPFIADERSAWIGEAWFGKQVGGIKLNHHWVLENDAAVGKLFGALDRNQHGDGKLTVGTGLENERYFWGAYYSHGLTKRREVNFSSQSITETISGNSPQFGPYLQDITTTTVTRTFEKAYEHSVGARLGHFYRPALLRLTAGLDHEWGKANSRLDTASLLFEKYFAGSPHSIALSFSTNRRRGEYETDRSDHRAGIFWRYDFGAPGASRSAERSFASAPPVTVDRAPAKEVAPPVAPEPQAPSITQQHAEAVFELGKADLTPSARQVLDDLLAKVRQGNIVDYRILATAHTCDIGSEAFNQKLSEKRAETVRSYLINAGLDPARITAEGMGERHPKYANTRLERKKNRRCEIEMTLHAAVPQAATPSQELKNPEEMTSPAVNPETPKAPEWIRRALLSPVRHKQTVDVYRTREREVTTQAGTPTYLNQAPIARDDSGSWMGSMQPAVIDVLANDSDPDGDSLTIVSVTQGTNGTVSIGPNGTLYYQGRPGWDGIDRFTYTVSDGKGKTATARVTFQIVDP